MSVRIVDTADVNAAKNIRDKYAGLSNRTGLPVNWRSENHRSAV
jgi:transposase